ncbi:hypothetical protein O3P69_011608 [Scylla paramamosain]|uniref:Uncharacterized protein n=1 Tax=Scylla paramamosain TaxID=85552 RepID=A0AAW0TA32_SCYPA
MVLSRCKDMVQEEEKAQRRCGGTCPGEESCLKTSSVSGEEEEEEKGWAATNCAVLQSVILLAVVLFLGVVAARPNEVLDFETDNVSHEQHGVPGQAVYGEYEAKDAHGNWYEVKYVADHHGFRTL